MAVRGGQKRLIWACATGFGGRFKEAELCSLLDAVTKQVSFYDWVSFFFWHHFFLICFLIYLFLAVLGLRCAQAFSFVESGGYSSLRCMGFSLRQLLLLRSTGSRHVGFSSCGTQPQQLCHTGLVAPRDVGSSQTRDRTHVPCIGRWILNHCTTREVPMIGHLNKYYLEGRKNEVSISFIQPGQGNIWPFYGLDKVHTQSVFRRDYRGLALSGTITQSPMLCSMKLCMLIGED